MKVQVLNGAAKIGDRVAYAVRDGNTAEIAVGEIVDIVDTGRTEWRYNYHTREREHQPVIRVKVHVTQRSGYGRVEEVSQVCGVERHERIVLLGGAA